MLARNGQYAQLNYSTLKYAGALPPGGWDDSSDDDVQVRNWLLAKGIGLHDDATPPEATAQRKSSHRPDIQVRHAMGHVFNRDLKCRDCGYWHSYQLEWPMICSVERWASSLEVEAKRHANVARAAAEQSVRRWRARQERPVV